MTSTNTMILCLFILIRAVQHLVERALARCNRQYYEDADNRNRAVQVLRITPEDMQKTLEYSRSKCRFSAVSSWIDILVLLLFLACGGLGAMEKWSIALAALVGGGAILTGLVFFALLGFAITLLALPFDFYYTFVLEDRHGFNRQTYRGFVADKIKEMLLALILGGVLLSIVLFIMQSLGDRWWLAAWLVVFGFSLFTAWIYPTVVAPLFNKFSPLDEGELKDAIFQLAAKIGFRAGSISVMDASKRSTHGNAYFTGIFGKKKIVLFDNLVKSMASEEVVAVLAHELGHFKLHHIRWRLAVSFFMMGIMFYLLSLTVDMAPFFQAFSLEPHTHYGALVVFSLWFGPLNFLMQPISNYFSRRHEFAADRFAAEHTGGAGHLAEALLKLREASHVMPINHPLFSAVYLSHPPLFERLLVMKGATE